MSRTLGTLVHLFIRYSHQHFFQGEWRKKMSMSRKYWGKMQTMFFLKPHWIFADILTKRAKKKKKKIWHWCLSNSGAILFSISNNRAFNQQSPAGERWRILIMFAAMPWVLNAENCTGKARLRLPPPSIKMCQVSESEEQLQVVWRGWTLSAGVGREAGNSTQRAAAESIIMAICAFCKKKFWSEGSKCALQ